MARRIVSPGSCGGHELAEQLQAMFTEQSESV